MTTRFALALLVALAFAVAPWVAARPGAAPAARPGPPAGSVAVLPFAAPNDLHDGVILILADWVKEIPYELIKGDSSLRVVRPQSVQSLTPPRDPDEAVLAGQRLGVAAILTGKVL